MLRVAVVAIGIFLIWLGASPRPWRQKPVIVEYWCSGGGGGAAVDPIEPSELVAPGAYPVRIATPEELKQFEDMK